MRPQHIALAVLCAITLLLTACNTGNGVVTVASTKSNLRIVNLIPNAGNPIDVQVDFASFARDSHSRPCNISKSTRARIDPGGRRRRNIQPDPADGRALGEANYRTSCLVRSRRRSASSMTTPS
jgi:hypothetical protein